MLYVSYSNAIAIYTKSTPEYIYWNAAPQLHNLIIAEHKMRDNKHVLPFPDIFISDVDYYDTFIVFRSTEHM